MSTQEKAEQNIGTTTMNGGKQILNAIKEIESYVWDQKAAEKGRTSAIDGVPLAQPALPLANKLIYRAEKFNYDLPISHPVEVEIKDEVELGNILLGIIDQAAAKGLELDGTLPLHRMAAKHGEIPRYAWVYWASRSHLLFCC